MNEVVVEEIYDGSIIVTIFLLALDECVFSVGIEIIDLIEAVSKWLERHFEDSVPTLLELVDKPLLLPPRQDD